MSQDLKTAISEFRQVLAAAERTNGNDGREAILTGLILTLNQTLVDLVITLERREKAVHVIEVPGPTGVPVKMTVRRLQ